MDCAKQHEAVLELVDAVASNARVSRADCRAFLSDLQYDIDIRLQCLDEDDRREAKKASDQ